MTGTPAASSCSQRQRLAEVVQQHLQRISQLSRATSEALANGNENLMQALDKEVELEIGAKERALGALREHRKEHGC